MDQFSGELPVLHLPIDFVRPGVQSFEGSVQRFDISVRETRALNALAFDEGGTLFMVLLACFHIFLSKVSGREDIVIGTPVAGRRHADLESVIGMFVNTLALRNVLPATGTFKEFLQHLKERTLNAFENQDYPLEDLVEKVVKERDMSRNPLFDVMFSLLDAEALQFGLEGFSNEGDGKISKFELTLQCREKDGWLLCDFEYCTRLFSETTITRFIAYFKNIVAAVIARGDRKLVELEFLPEEEKRRLLFDFNDTAAEYPKDKTIHQLFGEQAARTPDHVAIIGHSIDHGSYKTHMTYAQLNRKSDRSASLLRERGVVPGDITAIKMERSLEMMVGIYGILKAGAAYLPIDPNYPQDRIDYMMADSNANGIVTPTHPALRAPLSRGDLKNAWADSQSKPPLERALEGPRRGTAKGGGVSTLARNPENLAYVIYTSGSTGRPKGVMIEHRNVTNYIHGLCEKIPFLPGKSILAVTTITFDIFVTETLLPLAKGLTVVLAGEDSRRDPRLLGEIIKNYCIQMVQFTPSRLQLLLGFNEASGWLRGVTEVLVGGEVFPGHLLGILKSRGDAAVYNVYGPTEATVWATLKRLDGGGEINIGSPLPNLQVYILDRFSALVPMGVAGELCISGAGIARGYLNNPELTGEKFNKSYKSYRTYKTGDLCRW
ncbi:MAG: amino acid adenylation domain-containing protein, partial [bacterium]|nr:amino acid adenylation domain-containing protein [bacterium]